MYHEKSLFIKHSTYQENKMYSKNLKSDVQSASKLIKHAIVTKEKYHYLLFKINYFVSSGTLLTLFLYFKKLTE